ncbi:S8 family serine peptidase [Actinoplanes palleronii]|uniref:Subtilase family protein n=1 Tax=Actinoplanes palleronii TaxID=113570 RepID=A0ABQ4BCS9_9ACTN|nr:S8 family serine peptidase [Actinoplanes palleronii]GIE68488.1 hypothetical protein Apa02nite_045960 [Actinoplanes palleronii]
MRRLAATAIAVLAVTSLAVAARTAAAAPATGHYIVVLRDTAALRRAPANRIHRDHDYHHALTGFSAALSPAQLAALRTDPGVRYVVPDGAVHPDAGGPYRSDYGASEATGAGVTVYLADCHDESDVVRRVAPAARIVPVPVCAGPESAVIAAIDEITREHQGPSVLSLGLSAGPSRALDDAVAASVTAGVVPVVSAGGSTIVGRSACGRSPGRSAAVITVGVDAVRDFGTCLTLFAGTPLVAAAAALHLEAHPTAPPAAVKAWLIANAATGVLHRLPTGTPNRVLNIRAADATGWRSPRVMERSI